MKKDFEDKMSMIDSLRNEYEVDKDHALETLREEHRRELERVHLSQVNQQLPDLTLTFLLTYLKKKKNYILFIFTCYFKMYFIIIIIIIYS